MAIFNRGSKYVAAKPINDDPEENVVRWTEHSFSRHVFNPLLQNLFAGIGMALLWRFIPELIAIKWNTHFNSDTVGQVSNIMGVLFFSLLCVFRFCLDEVTAVITMVGGKLYEIKLRHDMTAMIDAYEGRLAQMAAYIKDLKAQLDVLGGITIKEPLTEQEILERKALAVKLYSRLINNLSITRDECLRVRAFETRTEWMLARQYLINAGVIEASGKPLPAAVSRGIALIESYKETLRSVRGKR